MEFPSVACRFNGMDTVQDLFALGGSNQLMRSLPKRVLYQPSADSRLTAFYLQLVLLDIVLCFSIICFPFTC